MAEAESNNEDELKQNCVKAEFMFVKVKNYLIELFCQRYLHTTKLKWMDNVESGRFIFQGLGKTFYEKASPQHKEMMLEGDLKNWEIGLLCGVLPLTIKLTGPKRAKLKWKEQNDSIRELGEIHKKVSASPKMTTPEFIKMAEDIGRLLINLEMNPERVELFLKAFVSQSVPSHLDQMFWALNSIRESEELAKEAFSQHNFEVAIQYLDKTLDTFHFKSKDKLSELLRMRAWSHVHWAHKQQDASKKEEHMKAAFLDAKGSIEFDGKGGHPEAHYVAGVCYGELQSYDESSKHFYQAIAGDPMNVTYRKMKDVYQLLAGDYLMPDLLAPPTDSLSFLQLVAVARSGIDNLLGLDVKNCLQSNSQFVTQEQLSDEQKMVILGYQHMYGWGQQRDLNEAYLCFQKAIRGATESEAKYNLGIICHFSDRTTNEHMEKGFLLLKEVAFMEGAESGGVTNNAGNVICISQAQFVMGLFHERGAEFGMEANVLKAAYWFKKSHKNGFAYATAKVGFMYRHGCGLQKSEKSAEMYFTHAINMGHSPAYVYLMNLYIAQKEFAKAQAVADKAWKANISGITTIASKLIAVIRAGKFVLAKFEPEVRETEENRFCLPTKGFTFHERQQRSRAAAQVHKNLVSVLVQDDLKIKVSNQNLKDTIPHVMNYDSLWDIGWKGASGSIIAKLLCDTAMHYFEFCTLLTKYNTDIGSLYGNENNVKQFVNSLYAVFESDPTSLVWDESVCSITYDHLVRIIQFGIGKSDREFCRKRDLCIAEITCAGRKYLGLGKDSDRFLVRAWTFDSQSIRIANSFVYHYLKLRDFDRAYLVGVEALERFRDEDMSQVSMCDLVYNHGIVCLLNDSSQFGSSLSMKKEAKLCFEKFIQQAPNDHKNMPEAYYNLGVVLSFLYKEMRELRDHHFDEVQHYLEEGELAEASQLQCFLPYESSIRDMLKDTVRMFMKKSDKGTNSLSNVEQIQVPVIDNVANVEPKLKITNTTVAQLVKSEAERILDEKHRVRLITNLRKELVKMRTCIIKEEDSSLDGVNSTPFYVQNLMSEEYVCGELKLTVVDEALLMTGDQNLVVVVAQDPLKRTLTLTMRKLPPDYSWIQNHIGFGRQIIVKNPHIFYNDSGISHIEIESLLTVRIMEKIKNPCRYCLKEEAPKVCTKCRRAQYCDKDCQLNDWTLLKHKLICKILSGAVTKNSSQPQIPQDGRSH
ncbi:unnamed protein product [Orchesella dallaii]|uniref:MYND-type domain-containing protein n=1 Tax=Orchesella dallaii TaxID=48710 RepID=A0ABP1R9G8_9HEXA